MLGSAGRTTVTDLSGRYAFSNLTAGIFYRVFVSHPNFSFTPTERTFSTLTQDQEGNFEATSLIPIDEQQTRIAYIGPGQNGCRNDDIYVMNADGSGLTNLTRGFCRIDGNILFGFKGSPAFSEDGSRIAFIVDASASPPGLSLWIMGYDGSTPTLVLHSIGVPDGPTWDKKQGSNNIAFPKTNPGGGSQIYAITRHGTNLAPVSRALGQDTNPDWQGNKIAFSRSGFNTFPCIYVINDDGTNETLLPGCTNDTAPSWTPDGTSITYLRNNYDVYTMGSNGAGRTRLGDPTNGFVRSSSKIAWDPNHGIKFAFTAPAGLVNGVWVAGLSGGTVGARTLLAAPGANPAWVKTSILTPPTPGPISQSGYTPNASSVTVGSGNVTVTFSSVQTAGGTTIDVLSPNSLLPLPSGYATIADAGLAYTISTTAVVTPPITTCIKVPSVDDEAVFNRLRILHDENGSLIDRTVLAPSSQAPDYATRTLCASTTDLGSFVVTQQIDASLPAVDGLVTDSSGNPFSDVTVELHGDLTLTTQTDINGRFRFVNLPPGGNYTVVPVGGTNVFQPQEATFSNLQLDQGALFTATACGLNLSSQSAWFTQAGGNGSFNINTASGGCGWLVTNDATWVTISSPASGSGTAAVDYQVQANNTVAPRVAIINVAGQVFRVWQTGTTALGDDAPFFVRQHYLDFLNREPDGAGWDYWTDQITQCGSDVTCTRNKRIDVSNAFFYELEYQQTGSYVFRLYRAAYGNSQPSPNPDNSNPTEAKKLPAYSGFAADRSAVVGGSNLVQSQLDLAKAFVQRSAFLAKYPAAQDGPTFVDALLSTIQSDSGANLGSQRQALIDLYTQAGGGNAGRAVVLYRVANDDAQSGNGGINNRAFIDAEYNRAFVFTQYAGYLRRDADIGGFLFWLGQVNGAPLRDVSKQHAMVCSFITSAEYQLRFGSVVTHSNAECPQ